MAVPYVVLPPKSLNFNMHYFTSTGDPDFPPSLTAAFSGLGANRYLVFCFLEPPYVSTSADIYNPGTGGTVKRYDAYNVTAGDWLANDTSGYAWIIRTIHAVTDAPTPAKNTGRYYFYATVEDLYAYNAGLDPSGSAEGGPQSADTRVVQFTVDENGIPVFRPSDKFTLSANFTGNILGRFAAVNNYTKQVRIYQTGASSTFAVGDPVFINTSTNQFQRSNTLGDVPAIYSTIGVIDTIGIPSADYFTFKPFGQYRSATEVPLTGPVGTTYYIDPTDTTQYTTTRPTNNPFPMYQIIDATGNSLQLSSGGGGGGGGGVGPTGPPGPITAYIFDGGNASSSYSVGPAFDCGNAS
jgi:hypothetical protein